MDTPSPLLGASNTCLIHFSTIFHNSAPSSVPQMSGSALINSIQDELFGNLLKLLNLSLIYLIFILTIKAFNQELFNYLFNSLQWIFCVSKILIDIFLLCTCVAYKYDVSKQDLPHRTKWLKDHVTFCGSSLSNVITQPILLTKAIVVVEM